MTHQAGNTLQISLELAHGLFSGVIADIPAAAASTRLEGATIGPIAAILAHAVYGEDLMLSQASGEDTLLSAARWQEATGIREASPRMTSEWLAADYRMDGLRRYAEAVFARASLFASSADTKALARPVTTPLGTTVPAGAFLAAFGTAHLMLHAGEIAALKGVQGLPGGLPM